MVRNEVIIGVKDVTLSSEWYQKLLDCKSKHGGGSFEILANQGDETILCLHRWGEHDHPTLRSPEIPPGNGLILYFRVDDLNKVWDNANELNATIVEGPNLNVNSGKKEFALRDLDNYYLLVSL